MKLFRVDASPKKSRSNSRALADHFVERLRAEDAALSVDALDVAANPPPHPTELFARAIYAPPAERTPEMRAEIAVSDALCARLLAADAMLFAMPMYNWSMPSTFKAFIDQIVRLNVTFTPNAAGGYDGALAGKRVLFITSRGGDSRPGTPYARLDALTPALRAAFGFIGATDMTFVDAQPLQFAAPDARAAALDRGKAELDAVARLWTAA